MFKNARNLARKYGPKLAFLAPATTPFLALATPTGVDFSSLTGGIVFTGVVTAILAVAALKVLPLVAAWGSKKILAMVGR